ncbi:hypothetical protein STEG23_032508 [Scotinomys teguina]
MSVEKEVSFRFSHPGPKVRSKHFRGPRGRSKTRRRGARNKVQVHRQSPEPYCKKAQGREKEKVWTPWNGLIVIGKRVELLDRNLQKFKLWDPKLESEDWKPEVVGKKILKERSSLRQDRVDIKLPNNVRRTSQAPASLEDESSEIWRQQYRLKAGAVSKSAETESEERLKSKGKLRTTGGDLRSRGDQLKQNEELESSGENLNKREKRVSMGEKVVGSGEKRRSVVEKVDSREKRGSIREKVSDSGEKRGSIREKVSDSGEKRGSIREKVSDSGEKRGSIKKASDSGERRGSIRKKLSDSGEKRGSIKEKVSDSGERRRSSEEKRLNREKLRSSGEKLRTGGKNLRPAEDKVESNIEEVQSDQVKQGRQSLTGSITVEEHSPTGSRAEETIERVINITGDESVMETMSQEMQIPSESVEGRDEGAEKGVEIDNVLDEMEATADESVPRKEKDVAGEGSRESGG